MSPWRSVDVRGVAAALCLYVEAEDGEVRGTELARFYEADVRRKPVIEKAKGLSRFLDLPEVSMLLRYDGDPKYVRIRRSNGEGEGGGNDAARPFDEDKHTHAHAHTCR